MCIFFVIVAYHQKIVCVFSKQFKLFPPNNLSAVELFASKTSSRKELFFQITVTGVVFCGGLFPKLVSI